MRKIRDWLINRSFSVPKRPGYRGRRWNGVLGIPWRGAESPGPHPLTALMLGNWILVETPDVFPRKLTLFHSPRVEQRSDSLILVSDLSGTVWFGYPWTGKYHSSRTSPLWPLSPPWITPRTFETKRNRPSMMETNVASGNLKGSLLAPQPAALSTGRKGHKKSRQGCIYCKRRKIKVLTHPPLFSGAPSRAPLPD